FLTLKRVYKLNLKNCIYSLFRPKYWFHIFHVIVILRLLYIYIYIYKEEVILQLYWTINI
ncbi:MAG: hypothetical protein N7Q72_06630, partial [Spiroplasma sp. Tabriz.8]|nr:hypothetical protein [Spiroplasma sp. Tabriz.8]